MDREEPMAKLKFEDSRSDMEDFGMENAEQVSKMPVALLASMGPLGRAGAQRVHEYCREKILKPLGKGIKRSSSEASVEEIPPPLVGIKKERHILVEDSIEEISPRQKIVSKTKEQPTASTSQCQPTGEDIKTDDRWAWLDKVLAEEVAYVSVSKEEDVGEEEDEDNQSVAMSNEV